MLPPALQNKRAFRATTSHAHARRAASAQTQGADREALLRPLPGRDSGGGVFAQRSYLRPVRREGERGTSNFGRVAVIHDWLTGMRGGEAVLEGILEVVPHAEIFTLFHFPGSVSPAIESHPIHTSRLQRLAARLSDYRTLLPLYPRAVRQWDLSAFDLVISSSHAVAKGVDARGKPHLCYCHTPMRYVWDRFDDYFPRGAKRVLMRPLAASLRRWDVASSAGVTRFVANSHFVADRIRRFYGRDAEVIHPFVDEAFLGCPLPAAR